MGVTKYSAMINIIVLFGLGESAVFSFIFHHRQTATEKKIRQYSPLQHFAFPYNPFIISIDPMQVARNDRQSARKKRGKREMQEKKGENTDCEWISFIMSFHTPY